MFIYFDFDLIVYTVVNLIEYTSLIIFILLTFTWFVILLLVTCLALCGWLGLCGSLLALLVGYIGCLLIGCVFALVVAFGYNCCGWFDYMICVFMGSYCYLC